MEGVRGPPPGPRPGHLDQQQAQRPPGLAADGHRPDQGPQQLAAVDGWRRARWAFRWPWGIRCGRRRVSRCVALAPAGGSSRPSGRRRQRPPPAPQSRWAPLPLPAPHVPRTGSPATPRPRGRPPRPNGDAPWPARRGIPIRRATAAKARRPIGRPFHPMSRPTAPGGVRAGDSSCGLPPAVQRAPPAAHRPTAARSTRRGGELRQGGRPRRCGTTMLHMVPGNQQCFPKCRLHLWHCLFQAVAHQSSMPAEIVDRHRCPVPDRFDHGSGSFRAAQQSCGEGRMGEAQRLGFQRGQFEMAGQRCLDESGVGPAQLLQQQQQPQVLQQPGQESLVAGHPPQVLGHLPRGNRLGQGPPPIPGQRVGFQVQNRPAGRLKLSTRSFKGLMPKSPKAC